MLEHLALLPLLYCSLAPFVLGWLINADAISASSFWITLVWTGVVAVLMVPLRRPVASMLLFLMPLLLGTLEVAHWLALSGPVTTASLYVLFESNPAEGREFFSDYFSFWKFAALGVYLVSALALMARAARQKRQHPGAGKRVIVAVVIFLMATVGFATWRNKRQFGGHLTYPTALYATLSYNQHIQSFRAALKARGASSVQAKYTGAQKTLTHVLVLGESVGRNHMSLYGYKRDTSPFLSTIADELVRFEDVVSSHASTSASLERVLTLSNAEKRLDVSEAFSVMEIAQAAGYETTWISNQVPVGIWDSKTAALASTSKHVTFVNLSGDSKRSLSTKSYDEKVLPPLEKALANDAPRKLIVVHLMGAHSTYANRYPERFDVFQGEDKSSRIVASYDNAVRYSDWVVHQVIERVRAHKGLAATVTYISDHGEEVHDVRPYHGHSWHKLSRFMLEVPFVFWATPAFKELLSSDFERIKKARQRPYMLDDLLHTMLDLMHVEYEAYEPKRSLYSPSYVPKKRVAHGKWDYDTQVRPHTIARE